MTCCQKITKSEFLWGKYNNFIECVEEFQNASLGDDLPNKAIDYIMKKEGPNLMPLNVHELMVLLDKFFVPYYIKQTKSIDFERIEKEIIVKLNEEQQKDFEEIKKNEKFVTLCKKYATGLTEIFLLI